MTDPVLDPSVDPDKVAYYAGLMAQEKQAQSQAATGVLLANQDANPDAAAPARALAPSVGAPASVVEANLPSYQQQAALAANRVRLDGNPVLAQWVAANPQSARIAKDDFDQLNIVSKSWGALKSGWTEAMLSNQRGRLGWALQTGNQDPAIQAQLSEIDRQLAQQPQTQGFAHALNTVSGFVAGLLDNANEAKNAAAGGIAAGAAMGSVIPGLGTSAGGVAGGFAGLTGGMAADQFKVGAGNMYLQLKGTTDDAGNPIDEGVAQGAAIFAGLTDAALMNLRLGSAGKGFQAGAQTLMRDAIKESLSRPGVAQALARFGGEYVKTVGEGAALGFAQDTAHIIAEQTARLASDGDFATIFNDPEQRAQAIDRLANTAKDMAAASALIALPGSGVHLGAELAQARRAKGNQQLWDSFLQASQDSKTRSRSPDAFAEFLAEHQGDKPDQIGVPAEKIQQFYQSMGIDPFALDDEHDPLTQHIPELKQQLAEGLATGGDVQIPTADFAAHLTGTNFAQFVQHDVRLTPDGWTFRESQDYDRRRPQLVAERAQDYQRTVEAEAKNAEPAQRVYDDFLGQLREGMPLNQAQQIATFMAAHYQTMGDRFGIDAWEKYRQRPIGIEFAQPDAAPLLRPELGQEGLNQMIAALKSGGLPSARAIHGDSLAEFLSRRGGLEDPGGELKDMGADQWHKGRPFTRKLLREGVEDGPRLPGTESAASSRYSLDEATHAAWEAGYFPETQGERPTPDHLIEALRGELAGQPRYVEENVDHQAAAHRQSLQQLDQVVNHLGLDVRRDSPEKIRTAIAEYDKRRQAESVTEAEGGKLFNQPLKAGVDLDRQMHILPISVGTETPRGAKQSQAALKHMDKSPVVNKDTGWEIKLSKGKLDDIASKFEKSVDVKDHQAALQAVRQITEEATLVDSHEDYKERRGVKQAHVLFTPIDIEGRRYAVKTTVLEYADKPMEVESETIHRLHEQRLEKRLPAATGADIVEAGTSSAEVPSREGLAPQTVLNSTAGSGHTDATIRLGDLLSGIKDHEGNRYAQADQTAKRGDILLSSSQAIIRLTQDRNLSTLLHETGHLWLDELVRDAAREDAPPQLRTDLATTLKWLGVDHDVSGPFDHQELIDKLGSDQHEQWARGFEAYLMEGKAPSPGLADIFRQFRGWLVRIYRSLRNLGGSVPPEVAKVMDRLLASEDEIQAMAERQHAQALFSSAKEAGLSPEQFQRYQDQATKATAAAEDKLLHRTMESLAREKQDWWKEEAARTRAEADQALMTNRKDLATLQYLRSGEFADGQHFGEPGSPDKAGGTTRSSHPGSPQHRLKLARAPLVDAFGPDILEKLPKGRPGDPLVVDKGGVHFNELSELMGYRSGDRMVRDLVELQRQQRELKAEGDKRSVRQMLVDQETDRLMAERHGDPFTDGSLERDALDALQNGQRTELLAQETRILMRLARGEGRAAGTETGDRRVAAERAKADARVAAEKQRGDYRLRRAETAADWDMAEARDKAARTRDALTLSATDLAAARDWAKTEIEGKTVRDATAVNRYAQQEAQAARATEQAARKHDYEAAAIAKRRQLLNHMLFIEAKRARDDVDRAVSMLAGYADKKTIASLPQGFLDQIHGLLERFDFKKVSQTEVQARKDFGRWLADQEQSGHEVYTAWADFRDLSGETKNRLLTHWSLTHYSDMTIGELRGLADTVKSIAHIGREQKKIEVAGAKADFDDMVDEAVESITANNKRRPVSRDINPGTAPGLKGALERAGQRLRAADSSLLKPEQMIDWLDGDDANGVLNRVVMRRLKEAQFHAADLQKEITARLRDLRKIVPEVFLQDMKTKKEVPELLTAEGDPWLMNKKEILALALNTGNESNLDKLARGYHWDKEDIQAVLDREMSKHDWDWVQGVWDTFGALWPETEALEKRLSGVAPDRIEARTVETPHGDYRGGYYPVIYDPLKSVQAEHHAEKARAGLFENGYMKATTDKSRTIERVDSFAAPIQLSIDTIPWKLGQAIHDIAYREAVMDVDRFLGDKRIRGAIEGTLGREYYQQFRPWLQSIANNRNIDAKGLAAWNRFAHAARTNTMIVGIGFRVSTMLKHGTTALLNSVGELGPTWLARGAAEFFGPPEKMARVRDMVFEKSGEMRNRMNEIDRDVRDALQDSVGDHSWRADVARYGHYGVAMLDMASAMPTWLGAYRKALSEGQAEADAVYAADKSVRKAHGAQGITDLADIQRGTETQKLFTMFYGFFNHIYNRQRDTVRLAGQGMGKIGAGDVKGGARDFAMVLARSFFYLAAPALIEAAVSEGGPDEDKGEGWGDWTAKAIAGEIPAGIPLFRDAAKAAISGRHYEMSPVVKAGDSLLTLGRDAAAAAGWTDQPVSSKWVKHAIEAPGYVFGLPTGQASGTLQYLWDVMDGDQNPEDLADFLRGVVFGKGKAN